MRTAHLEDRPLYWLQCAMEENCVASQAYKIQKESDTWHLESRRLLRFTARTLNAGNADFRPAIPKHLWEWHMCHMLVSYLLFNYSLFILFFNVFPFRIFAFGTPLALPPHPLTCTTGQKFAFTCCFSYC